MNRAQAQDRRDDWEFMVPYGKWTCADGREVLHNRAYRPILEKYPGQPARAARSGEWVKDASEGTQDLDASEGARRSASVAPRTSMLTASSSSWATATKASITYTSPLPG